MMVGSAMQQGGVPVAGGCCLAGARIAAQGDRQPPAASRSNLPLPLRERAGERGNQIMKHHLQMPIREYLSW